MYKREDVVAVTRTWLGTPYHHQAYLKGIGADCLGLLRGVYVEIHKEDPEPAPRYSPGWGDANPDELLLKAAEKYLVPVPYVGYKLGDVLVFRVKNAMSAKHCAIVSGVVPGHETMIHAVSRRAVLETGIGAWSSKVAGVFAFPGVEGV